MEYVFSKLESPESTGNHSVTPKCRFKSSKIHELQSILKLKTRASCVLVSLIPG